MVFKKAWFLANWQIIAAFVLAVAAIIAIGLFFGAVQKSCYQRGVDKHNQELQDARDDSKIAEGERNQIIKQTGETQAEFEKRQKEDVEKRKQADKDVQDARNNAGRIRRDRSSDVSPGELQRQAEEHRRQRKNSND